MLFRLLILIFFSSCTIALSAQTSTTAKDELATYFKPLKWRCIGPYRGGRSVAACGVVSDPNTYYMGVTGGGLWKTTDMGLNWSNVSDGYFKTGSIGAVTVAESDPNIVYVGMGEHAVRGVMTHHGDGIYKSTDAGKTWTHLGLAATLHIARIIVHPKDANVVYVAAQGALYGPSAERGLYKSIDGGATWKKVLYTDENTGCNELSIDANNSRIMYAAMWEHGRKPWQIKSGGPGSGLYKSVDGGEHWEKMENGLPKDMGKMSIAVCPSNSEKVYALIESNWEKEAGGLYMSTNAGKDWSQVSKDHRLIQRAWYYIELFVDPQDEDDIYVLSASEMKSTDGGSTWTDVSDTHGDYHNLWINPHNPANMIIADDGGAAITFNKGKSWTSQTLPTGQFYRINVDNAFPYNIYAGQQDNSSVKIASRNISDSGITRSDWTSSAGGESAFLAFNPDDPRYVMGGSYQGTIEVIDTKAKANINVMAAPIQYLGRDAKDMKYRFNWNAPIICSPNDPNVFYHGAQKLLRTRDLGLTWEEASPDLTRNEKEKQGRPGIPYTNEAVGAENYGTISYIIESPLEKGVIYTGSDDGLVHITTDDGKNWKNITPKGLSECLINAIEVSPFDKGTAYIATTRYKFNDHTPGLYKTTDYGKTWTKIDKGIAANAFTRVIREDNKVKGLLFAGTELGLYISINGGADWQPFQLNLPITPITDLKIHHDNVIVSTSGRAFWILDDLPLIRQYKKDINGLTLYHPAPIYLVNARSELDKTDSEFTGLHASRGINPASGTVIYYNLPELKDSQDITIVISDTKDKVIRKYSSKTDANFKKYDGGPKEEPTLSKNKGLNRFVWDTRCSTLPGVTDVYIEGSYRGHKVPPGMYKITLHYGTISASTSTNILPNPTYNVAPSQYEEYHELMSSMEANFTDMHTMVNALDKKRCQLNALIEQISMMEKHKEIVATGQDLIKKMKDWDEAMVQRKSKAYDDVENFPNKFTSDYLYLINQTESDLPRVNQSSKELMAAMNADWQKLKIEYENITNQLLPSLNKQLWDAGIGAIWHD